MSFNKSKSYSSSQVLCPYYQAEIGSMIYCEGTGEGQCFHVAFSNAAQKKTWKARYCLTWEYGECIIAHGQESLWTS